MTAYKYSRRSPQPFLFLLALGGVGLTSWGTWRSRQPTLQILLAPQELRSLLANPKQDWRFSQLGYERYERYQTWQFYLSGLPLPVFTRDGKNVLAVTESELCLFDVATGNLVRKWRVPLRARGKESARYGREQNYGLELFSSPNSDAWYVWHRHNLESAQVYRITLDQTGIGSPLPELRSVVRISPDGRSVEGVGARGRSYVWEVATGKTRALNQKDGGILFGEFRIDPLTSVWYRTVWEGKKLEKRRLMLLDPQTQKELSLPDYLKDPTIVACRLNQTEIITGHRDGTLQVRSRQAPEVVLQTIASGIDTINWVAGSHEVLQAGGHQRTDAERRGRFVTVLRDRQGKGRDKTFVTPNFATVDAVNSDSLVSESVERWGKTRLYVLGRTWYKDKVSAKHEAWIGDVTNGKQVRIPWNVSAAAVAISPKEDVVAWIDKTGTLNLWRVPL